jgi:hypothetical protein
MSEKSPEEVLERARNLVHLGLANTIASLDIKHVGGVENASLVHSNMAAAIDRLAEIAGIVGEIREHARYGGGCAFPNKCADRAMLLAKLRELDGKEGE